MSHVVSYRVRHTHDTFPRVSTCNFLGPCPCFVRASSVLHSLEEQLVSSRSFAGSIILRECKAINFITHVGDSVVSYANGLFTLHSTVSSYRSNFVDDEFEHNLLSCHFDISLLTRMWH